ncbi:superoxide dismutase [Dysgonomonas sp. 511]|nr:superoxide dismutase [Dysgonomonas sp. 511]
MKKTILALTILFVFAFNTLSAQNNSNKQNKKAMKFELPKLPYATNALEPVIGQQTVELHYGKHLQTYITNLNNLIQGTKFENTDLETIVKESDGAIFNNAGQTLNHNIYFLSFSPKGGGEPKGKLAEAINKQWGSFDNFKKEFNAAGTSLFGSGWVWLAKDKDGKLEITKDPNAGNPITKGLTPLLGFDVWEHAYYLDYQNRRVDHLTELWKIIDWDAVGARY